MTIRPETPADHDVVRAVHEAAFRESAVPELVDRIRASDRYVPELSLVAEEEGQVVGHVMLRYVDLDGARVLTLSPIGVRPERQGQGIGGMLVREVLRLADERGEPLVVLEGDPAYYGRFGFRSAAELGVALPRPRRRVPFRRSRWPRTTRSCAGGCCIRPRSTSWPRLRGSSASWGACRTTSEALVR